MLRPSVLNLLEPEFEVQVFPLTELDHSEETRTSGTLFEEPYLVFPSFKSWFLLLVSGSMQAKEL